MDSHSASAAIMQSLIAEIETDGPNVSTDAIRTLAKDYGIPVEHVAQVRASLTLALRRYLKETEFSKVDFKAARNEISSLARTAELCIVALDSISATTLDMFQQAAIAHGLQESSVPTIDRTSRDDLAPASFELLDGRGERTPLSEIRQTLQDLSAACKSANRVARAGKKGQPRDDAAFEVVFIAYQLWTAVLRREFSLDWTSDNQGVSKAAKWCADVFKLIDPKIDPRRVTTNARKVRETCIPVSDLEDIERFSDIFSERMK